MRIALFLIGCLAIEVFAARYVLTHVSYGVTAPLVLAEDLPKKPEPPPPSRIPRKPLTDAHLRMGAVEVSPNIYVSYDSHACLRQVMDDGHIVQETRFAVPEGGCQ